MQAQKHPCRLGQVLGQRRASISRIPVRVEAGHLAANQFPTVAQQRIPGFRFPDTELAKGVADVEIALK